MAEIDKGLPNTRTKVEVPSEEELQEINVQEPIEEKGPVEVVPEEDGGATIDFEPGAINIPGTESHFDNFNYMYYRLCIIYRCRCIWYN